MPFASSSAADASPPPSDALHVFAIGVSTYRDPEIRTVRSATDSALAWMLQGLRSNAAARANHLLVEEASQPSELKEHLRSLLDLYGLSESERSGINTALEQLSGARRAWEVLQPTAKAILRSLVLTGNNVRKGGEKDRRLLVTFAGHGAVSQGELCLCASDTVMNATAASAEALTKRYQSMRARLTAQQAAPRPDRIEGDWAGRWGTCVSALDGAWKAAPRYGAQREVIEVFEVLVELQLTSYSLWPEVIGPIMVAAKRNLLDLPENPTRVAVPLGNVLTMLHFQLILGDVADRVTLVLDACHAGGPGDALQGSVASHAWINGGFGCRIISASESGALAVEARLGEDTHSVATWALTRVLSRWKPVRDGTNGWAVGIRNGELVHRANLLCQALSFRQQLSLHAPRPKRGLPLAADMPFCGLHASTRTTTEPDEDAGSIQLSAGNADLWSWVIKVGSDVRGVFILPGQGVAQSWTYNGRSYAPGYLSVFSTKAHVELVADATQIVVTKYHWPAFVSGAAQPPPAEVASALGGYSTNPVSMPGVNDSGESKVSAAPSATGLFKFQKAGGKAVYLQFLKASGTEPARLSFITCPLGFPYLPDDFGDSSTFDKVQSAPAVSEHWKRPIDYP